MTSRTLYVLRSPAVSGGTSEIQVVCSDGAWQQTVFSIDKPIDSSGTGLVRGLVRLDDGVAYWQQLGILKDSQRLIILDKPAQRQILRAKKVVLQYDAEGGKTVTLVFQPPRFDEDTTIKYCGADPQAVAALQVEIFKKKEGWSPDWFAYEIDSNAPQSSYISLLPLILEADSSLRVSVQNKAMLQLLGFRMNGQEVKPEWVPVKKDRYSKFAVTFQVPR